ncbi:MAG: methylamine dehydrogenase accessory protein MauD [Caulobacteraceae bacterium]|nr:methylamine dehydrogenase accessory protein MauD [Caulobacteraceae bacterium]
MTFLIASQVLLWVLVLGLLVVVLALARQIGLLHERIAPVGALAVAGGPEVGQPAPPMSLQTLDGSNLQLGAPSQSGRMILFVSSDCPVCKRLIPLAKSVAKAEQFDLVFAGDAPSADLRALVGRYDLEAYPFVNSRELGMAFQVAKLPYAVLLDEAGRIAAKGLVNTREHLESLVTAKSVGFASIQSYLAAREAEPSVTA